MHSVIRLELSGYLSANVFFAPFKTMAAVLQNVEFGLKKTGTSVTVPDHPQAKLMFYLNCMCQVLDLGSSSSSLNLLRDYRNYHRLSYSQVDELLVLCLLISPDVLLNKCIFHNEAMCGNSQNEFFELSAVASEMLVTESVLIGGQRRRVETIMTFKGAWLQQKYFEPMGYFRQRLERIANACASRVEPRPQPRAIRDSPSSCCCIVL